MANFLNDKLRIVTFIIGVDILGFPMVCEHIITPLPLTKYHSPKRYRIDNVVRTLY